MAPDLQAIVQVEEPSPGRKVFSVELAEGALRDEMEREFRRVSREAKFPGFRPGKAPRSLVEARFGASVRSEALEKIVSRALWETLRESEVVPFFDPEIEELSAEEGDPVRFRFAVDVWPEIELRKYKEFDLQRRVAEVTDEEIENEIRSLQETHVDYVPVERGAIRGDQMLLSYQRFFSDGNAFGKRVDGAEVVIHPEESSGVQDAIEQGLLGVQPGEKRGIPVSFPDDHPTTTLAGKDVEFRVEVEEVRERVLPVVDDDFARRILGEDADLGRLKERIREALADRAEREADRKLDEKVLDLLIQENVIHVSDTLLEKVTQANLPRFPAEGEIPPDQREEAARRKASLIEQHRKGALRAIQKLVLISEISNRENLEPGEKEVKATLDALRSQEDPSLTPEKREEERENRAGEIRRILRERKVLEFIKKHSTVS